MAISGPLWAIAAVAALAVLACSPAAANHGPALPPLPRELSLGNSSGPVVTPAQAGEIVSALWPLRERALAQNDAAATDRLETDVAREFDDAVSADDRARPHLPNLRTVRGHLSIWVFVPVQRTYPAAFLAEVVTSLNGAAPSPNPIVTSPYSELMVMTRRDRWSTWMLGLDTGYAAGPSVFPDETGAGFDAGPLPSWAAPADLPGMLAGYWQSWIDTGAPPAGPDPWGPGYWTTERGGYLAQHRNGAPQASCGCIGQARYAADPAADGLWTFTIRNLDAAGPLDLTCSTVRVRDRLSPAPPDTTLQQDDLRDNWGGLLAPGLYTSMTQDSVRQTCIESAPARSAGLAAVGGNGDVVRVQGSRAP
jgi:hypothetical protein